jgi:hypothetical protein
MTRRRLILAACVAVVAQGGAWWLWSAHEWADEQRLVGTWHLGNSPTWEGSWTFGADRVGHRWVSRRGFCSLVDIEDSDHWSLRGGMIVLDGEPSAFRRTIRPLLHFFGQACAAHQTFPLESVTDDQMVIVWPGGEREFWTRDRGE